MLCINIFFFACQYNNGAWWHCLSCMLGKKAITVYRGPQPVDPHSITSTRVKSILTLSTRRSKDKRISTLYVSTLTVQCPSPKECLCNLGWNSWEDFKSILDYS